MSPRRLALARFLIRRYPRRWRERYADEVLAMIEEAGVTPLGLFDLARGAVGEQVRVGCDRILGPRADLAVGSFRRLGRLLLWWSAALGLWFGAGWLGGRAHEQGLSVSVWTLIGTFVVLGAGAWRLHGIQRDMLWYRGRPAIPPTPGLGYREALCWLMTGPLLKLNLELVSPATESLALLCLWQGLVVGNLAQLTRRTPSEVSLLQQQLAQLGSAPRSVLGLSEPGSPVAPGPLEP